MGRRKVFGPELPPAMKKARAAAKKSAKSLASTAHASKAMVTLIKKVATTSALKELETKYVSTSTGGQAFNSVIHSGASEMYSLIPPVSPPATAGDAAGDWQRANNDITPLSCKTTWHFALTPVARSMNIVVVLYCLQSKSQRDYAELGATFPTGPYFLKNGIATQISQFDGIPVSGDLPVNIEDFTLLHKKKFHLCNNVGLPNGDVTAGNSPNVSGGQSYREHSYYYKCPKQLRYTPGSGTQYPQGHAPFWMVGYYHVDGSVPDVFEQDLTVSWCTQMTFKDA